MFTLKLMPNNNVQKIINKIQEEHLIYNISIYDMQTLIYVKDRDLDILMNLVKYFQGEGIEIKNTIYTA